MGFIYLFIIGISTVCRIPSFMSFNSRPARNIVIKLVSNCYNVAMHYSMRLLTVPHGKERRKKKWYKIGMKVNSEVLEHYRSCTKMHLADMTPN